MKMLTRPDWGATLRLGPRMKPWAEGIHVHHSVTIADDDHSLEGTGDVRADMREIEAIGAQRFGRFPYSYCIHPSGLVGVGAGVTVGAHTRGWNSTSFGVCFIGNYQHDRLTRDAMIAFGALRQTLVDSGWLRLDHYVRPHRERAATACPGDNIIDRWEALLMVRPTRGLPERHTNGSEDDITMKDYLLQAPDRPAAWVRGEQLIKLRDRSSVEALHGAGVPIVNPTTGDYDRIAAGLRTVEIDIVEDTP